VLEASTKPCLHCEGTGLMRTASSSGLSALRIIEDEAARGRGDRILLRAGREAAIYVLNKKRAELAEIDERYGVTVEVMIDEAFEGARMSVESSGARPNPKDRALPAPIVDEDEDFDEVEAYDDVEDEAEEVSEERPARREGGRDGPREPRGDSDEDGARRKRRRRRGGRGRNRRDGERDGVEREAGEAGEQDEQALSPVEGDEQQPLVDAERQPEQGEDGEERQRSRRGRRGGRSRRGRSDAAPVEGDVQADGAPLAETQLTDEAPIAAVAAPVEIEAVEEKPKARRRPRARKADTEAPVEVAAETPAAPVEAAADVAEAVPAAPKRRSRAKKVVLPVDTDVAIELAVADASAEELPIAASNDQAAAGDQGDAEGDGSGARRGWWQRTFG
jgi:ribonuclease E